MAFVRSLAVAAASPLLVRLRPSTLARVLERGAVSKRPRPEATAAVERALEMTAWFVRHTCYTRGVTRYYVLRRAGLRVHLVFGLDPTVPGGEGHCWVVVDGGPYLERADALERFARTWSIGDV